MLNVSLTKLTKKLRKFYHLFIEIIQKGTNKLKAEITSFITSDASSCLPYFFRRLDNSYSLNILKSECLSTWDYSQTVKWLACVLTCFSCFTCFVCSHDWRAHALYELGILTCLACFIEWHISHASKKWRTWYVSSNSLQGVLHKIARSACLKIVKYLLDVFDHGVFMNCRL